MPPPDVKEPDDVDNGPCLSQPPPDVKESQAVPESVFIADAVQAPSLAEVRARLSANGTLPADVAARLSTKRRT